MGAIVALECLILILACNPTGIHMSRVTTGAMEPTFQIGERFLWLRIGATGRSKLACGDLIIHYLPEDRETMWLHRLVGRGGDSVEIRANQLIINGKPIQASWGVHDCGRWPCDFGPFAVPSGKVFVIGDTWENSRDSRVYGPLDDSLIVGRVLGKK